MIFHLSIPARDPKHVADVLAEIWKGRAFPFHPFPGAFIVLNGDGRGTAVEVLPETTELDIGETMVEGRSNGHPSDRSSAHMAIASPLSSGQIHAIGEREDWLTRDCDRGPFQLIEMWIENRFLAEIFPPELQERYSSAMTIENWERWT